MIVILHVEDNTVLGALVAVTLAGLGFSGRRINATTVTKAEAILDEAALKGEPFDLIISDMHLPDGTGLDVVRHVRENPKWKGTPMLILSGDVDPKTVARAYALGANAYISKFPPGRSLGDVVTSLYHHWIEDVVTPNADASATDATRQALRRAMNIRLRHAHLYQELSERFADDTPEMAFWLSRALAESNLINILGFVQQQLPAQPDIGEHWTEQVSSLQRETEARLSAFEHDLDTTTLPREEIYKRVLELVSISNVDVLARSMARAFPVASVAIDALRDFLVSNYERMTAWIEEQARAPALHDEAQEVRETALENRAIQ
jgi:CheY-like chemotaxis protein